MDEIRKKAHELLQSGEAKVVIGYEEGKRNQTRPVFISNPDDTIKLIFDSRCVQNLAVYLSKPEVKAYGKPAIIAPVPVLRSIIQLASENQISNDSAIILGVSPEGKLINFSSLEEVETYIDQFQFQIEERDKEILDRINQMNPEERWKFWIETLTPCFKCYACRAACPMCYCPKCTVEQTQPQWIPVASHQLGNLEWHFMRAMHMAGRCVDCGACALACPVAIPLNLLTRKMMEDLKAQFGEYRISIKKGNALSTFKPEDSETFIR
jgi:heterodisulfide reductase subunit C